MSLYMKENPGTTVEDSISYMTTMLDEKRKELVEHSLMDGLDDLPKPCKHLHLSCFKAFQMFYNSRNRFDSNTELIQDINKAIYMPLELKLHTSKPLKPQLPHHVGPKIKAILTMNTTHFHRTHKPGANTTFIMPLISPEILREGNGKMFISLKPKLCFI